MHSGILYLKCGWVYLTDILRANDPGLLAAALAHIASARGMSDIAKSAGLAREVLYKALRPGSTPRFDIISRARTALVVQPGHTG